MLHVLRFLWGEKLRNTSALYCRREAKLRWCYFGRYAVDTGPSSSEPRFRLLRHWNLCNPLVVLQYVGKVNVNVF